MPRFRGRAAERERAPSAARDPDISPDEVVGLAVAEEADRHPAGGAGALGRERRPRLRRVAELLVFGEERGLRLVHRALHAALGVEAVELREVGAHIQREPVGEAAGVAALEDVEHLDRPAEVQSLRLDVELELGVGEVHERDVARLTVTLVRVLHEDISVAPHPLRDVRLKPEVVLAHRQQIRIGDERERLRGDRADVASDEERGREHAPQAEVELLLVRREALVALAEHRLDLALEMADLEHVHVVVRARLRVRREVEVLLDDALEGLPVRADVAGRAPRLRDVRGPRAGERPAADVEPHVVASGRAYRLRYLGVARALVELETLSAAVVHLDEVEAEVDEVELAVRRVVSVQPAALPAEVVVALGVLPHAAAGVRARVGVDARLEPQRVDSVDRGLHSVREPPRVEPEDAVLAVSAEESVVNVHVRVARGLESVRRHRARGVEDHLLGYLASERVPAGPAHQRTLHAGRRERLREREEPPRARGARFAVRALEPAQVDERRLRVVRYPDLHLALRAVPEHDVILRLRARAKGTRRQRGGANDRQQLAVHLGILLGYHDVHAGKSNQL